MMQQNHMTAAVGLVAVFTLAATTAVSVADLGSVDYADAAATAADDDMEWVNTITVRKNGELIHKSTNILVNQGKDFIAWQISNASTSSTWSHTSSAPTQSANATYIAVGNGSAPVATDDKIEGEFTTDGLSRADGAVSDTGTGQYDVQNTFVYSGSSAVTVNNTGLYWNQNEDSLVSGAAFNNEAVLENGDELTVTHSITIQDGG